MSLLRLLAAWLLCWVLPAHAANYVFPGTLPAACSGSGGTYTCSGGFALSNGDTVTINAPKPATITVTGSVNLANSSINLAGNASDLNLVVTGTLTLASGTRIKANITVGSVFDPSGGAILTGNLSASTGSIALATGTQLTGNITTTTGGITLNNTNTVGGNVSCQCTVAIYNGSSIGGTTTATYVYNGIGTATFGGAITTTTGGAYLQQGSTVAGGITATSGTITLLGNNNVNGNLSCTCTINAYASLTISGSTSATYLYHPSPGNSTFGGGISTTTGGIYLGSGSTVTGNLVSTSGAIYLLGGNTITGTIGCSCSVLPYAGSSVAGDITANVFDNGSGANSVFSGSVNITTGYATLGIGSSIGGSITSTSGAIYLYSTSTVAGAIECSCTLTAYGTNTVGGRVSVDTFSDSGGGTFSNSVTTYNNATLGSASRVTGDLTSISGAATQNSNSTVSQCVKVRDNGSHWITLYSGASAGGTCCGKGTCGTACVLNFSGHAAPSACASSTPAATAEYRFDEKAWNGTAGEVIDSSGSGNHASRLNSAAISTAGKVCNAGDFPSDTSTTAQAVRTGINVPNTVGPAGTISFWYRGNGAWGSMADGQLLDATTASNRSFHLVRRASGALQFTVTDSGGGVLTVTTPTQAFAAGTWVHIAVAWSLEFGFGTGSASIYVNGSASSNTAFFSYTGLDSSIGELSVGDSLANITSNNATVNSANGRIDELRVHRAALVTSEITALMNTYRTCSTPNSLVAQWDFETITSATTPDSSGNGNTLGLGTSGIGQATGKVGNGMTLNGAGPAAGASTGAVLDTTASYTVAGWVKYTAMSNCMAQALISQDGVTVHAFEIVLIPNCGLPQPLFFEILASDSDATSTKRVYSTFTPVVNTWYHMAGVRDATANTMSFYVNCTLQGTASSVGTFATAGPLTVGRSRFSGSDRDYLTGMVDGVKVWNYARSAAQIATECTSVASVHHLEIQHASGTGLTCTPSTLTVRACQDAACTSLYTGGVSGTLTATGAGMTVNWPTTAAFTIPSGSSSVTEDLQLVTAGSVLLGLTGASPAPANATTCNFGSPSCTYTASDAGLFFDVPNHRAEVSYSVSVTAVKKADNAAACVPAFASVSKAVNFKCSYVNPTTGTQAVRVGGAALNSGNSAGSACDATGQSVTLAFDATGKATTSVIYADAGAMTLTGTYAGSGADAGLTMIGSDTFIAAPYSFTVAGPAAGNITAGSNFAGSVTAKNYLGNTMPNFGRETSPEGATLGWVRTQPQGSAAVNGAFTGSLGSFTAGAGSSSTLKWSEVGRGELTAVLTSGSYLGSGMTLAGATVGLPVLCSAEWDTCSLPAGVTATVYYGANGLVAVRSGMSGDVWCANGVFGDPNYGFTKYCWYVVTSGSSAASSGTVGPFIPHHFDVTATRACSSTFSYAGQPFSATVTARNASNATTVNYDGSANTSPNFAKVTTLADIPVLGLGSWSNASVPVASFALGVATATPNYAFTSKTTAPQSFAVRATDTDAVSSLNFVEPTMPLRSGRLAISNAFGSEKTSLAVPVQAQYWSGLAWVQNSADSCTSVPAASVVRAGYVDGKGAATTAWTSTASAISISAGAGTLTLGAPSPTSTGSLDFSLNLGSTTADQSCLAAHPSSTGAGLSWLRSQNGACSTAWDRDPSARATFGIYAPETRKTIHVREIF